MSPLLLLSPLLGRSLALAQSELQQFPGCSLIPTEWGDGYSFLIRTAERNESTIRLYGIGEKRALGIIDHRPHLRPEDLLRVPTIGEGALDEIRQHLDFSEPSHGGSR